jgi:hypothetical protein
VLPSTAVPLTVGRTVLTGAVVGGGGGGDVVVVVVVVEVVVVDVGAVVPGGGGIDGLPAAGGDAGDGGRGLCALTQR